MKTIDFSKLHSQQELSIVNHDVERISQDGNQFIRLSELAVIGPGRICVPKNKEQTAKIATTGTNESHMDKSATKLNYETSDRL